MHKQLRSLHLSGAHTVLVGFSFTSWEGWHVALTDGAVRSPLITIFLWTSEIIERAFAVQGKCVGGVCDPTLCVCNSAVTDFLSFFFLNNLVLLLVLWVKLCGLFTRRFSSCRHRRRPSPSIFVLEFVSADSTRTAWRRCGPSPATPCALRELLGLNRSQFAPDQADFSCSSQRQLS